MVKGNEKERSRETDRVRRKERENDREKNHTENVLPGADTKRMRASQKYSHCFGFFLYSERDE